MTIIEDYSTEPTAEDILKHQYARLVWNREKRLRSTQPDTTKPATKPLDDEQYKAALEKEYKQKNDVVLKSPFFRTGVTGVSIASVVVFSVIMLVWDYVIGSHDNAYINQAFVQIEKAFFSIFILINIVFVYFDGALAIATTAALIWLAAYLI